MTKVTILGENPNEEKELKPIEVTHILLANGETRKYITNLSDYQDLKIIKLRDYQGFDCLIIANPSMIFLGQFNAGIV